MQQICPVFHLLEEQEPVWTWLFFPRGRHRTKLQRRKSCL